jgi:hypothetical protein
MKHFGEVFFVLVFVFFIWTIMGPTGTQRIHRVCTPVAWAGDGVTSLARAAGTNYGKETHIASQNIDYRCQMAIWDFFYRQAWLKAHPQYKHSTTPPPLVQKQ